MSRASRFADLIAEYGKAAVDEVLSALGRDAEPEIVKKAVAQRAKSTEKAAPAKVATKAAESGGQRLAASAAKSAAKKSKAPAVIKKASGAEKRAPAKANYSREELAVRYPEVPEPVLKVDRKTGKQFLSKGVSREAEALSKARQQVMAEMREEGFTPFFDPEARYYADPSGYSLSGRTADIRPARPETIAKYEAMANDPAALDRLRAAYALGSQYPGAKQWYAMGQLEDAFKTLGPEEGRRMFKERFADAMAATTGGMDPDANLRLAHYMNFLRQSDAPTPLASYELPFPIGGGKYGVMPNVAQYESLINQGGGLTVLNPKRFNFSADFLGNVDRPTLDEQMMSAWDPKLQMPPPNTYGIYEGALSNLAEELGVPAAEAQDVMWAGIKLPKESSYVPKPMIQIVNEAIERTSRLTGMSPEEVVEEGLVKAKRPLYAKGGAV